MKRARWQDYRFAPEEHEGELLAIIRAIEALPDVPNLDRILRRHPKDGATLFRRASSSRATGTWRRGMPTSPIRGGSWKR